MSLAEYLAKNYLTADPSPTEAKSKKKRKRKDLSTATNGLVIADDDASGWDNRKDEKDDEDGPITVFGNSATFRKAKSSSWKTVGAPPPSTSEQAAADAILRSAADEQSALRLADEEAPTISNADEAPQMESGAHAGLQTAAQVSAAVKRKQREERLRFEQDGDQHVGKGAETIYRDASGKIINVAMERAKARAKQEAEEKKAREEAEAMKAPAQREQDRRRKEQLKEAKLMPFARGVDDLELNEELKERDRWADPAAGFLEKKKEGKSVTGKPLYKGPGGQVNRYGIPPGYRWDGVDRGNGFEKKWFAARAKAKGRKEMEVQWEMDE